MFYSTNHVQNTVLKYAHASIRTNIGLKPYRYALSAKNCTEPKLVRDFPCKNAAYEVLDTKPITSHNYSKTSTSRYINWKIAIEMRPYNAWQDRSTRFTFIYQHI